MSFHENHKILFTAESVHAPKCLQLNALPLLESDIEYSSTKLLINLLFARFVIQSAHVCMNTPVIKDQFIGIRFRFHFFHWLVLNKDLDLYLSETGWKFGSTQVTLHSLASVSTTSFVVLLRVQDQVS